MFGRIAECCSYLSRPIIKKQLLLNTRQDVDGQDVTGLILPWRLRIFIIQIEINTGGIPEKCNPCCNVLIGVL